VKASLSNDRNTDTTSAFIPGKIQIASADCSVKSTHPNTSKVHRQQQNRQVNTADVKTSSNSAEIAIQCEIMTATSAEKNKEITAFVENFQNKVHAHRFRRKKRQKNPRQDQAE